MLVRAWRHLQAQQREGARAVRDALMVRSRQASAWPWPLGWPSACVCARGRRRLRHADERRDERTRNEFGHACGAQLRVERDAERASGSE
jgi:hypothetical protein